MSSFLDDQLFEFTKNASKNWTDASEVNDHLNQLYKMCEASWKPKCVVGVITEKEVKAHLDRTFSYWDSYIKKLTKDGFFLADIFAKYSYKNIFMDNEKLSEAYKRLSKC